MRNLTRNIDKYHYENTVVLMMVDCVYNHNVIEDFSCSVSRSVVQSVTQSVGQSVSRSVGQSVSENMMDDVFPRDIRFCLGTSYQSVFIFNGANNKSLQK